VLVNLRVICQVDKAELLSQSLATHKRTSTFDDLPASKAMRHSAAGDHVTSFCQPIGDIFMTATLLVFNLLNN